jgi:hypothetical protein
MLQALRDRKVASDDGAASLCKCKLGEKIES